MVRCKKCILPETFPGISFDNDGICSFCQKARNHEESESLKQKYKEKFLNLINGKTESAPYDVIMAYSGGKDSTYTLYLFKKVYNLDVLALTFDNGFISQGAFENIQRVCERLEIDSMIVRPDPTMLKKIFLEAAKRELYPPKTLERASTICTSCIGLVKSIVLKTAIEKSIPFVGFGWSPGQAPIKSSVMRTNAIFVKKAQELLLGPMEEIVGPKIKRFFLDEKDFQKKERFPWNIHPLAFENYDEVAIVRKNQEFGWKRPKDTDPNSSNCLLNAFANYVHRKRYNFHPYAWEIANMVRQGVMTRQEGLEKIEPPEDEQMVNFCQERLVAAAS